MTRLAHFAISHPRGAITSWLGLIGVLVVLGLGVADRLHRNALGVPGTEAHKAVELANQEFGERYTLIVMLQGPRDDLDAQSLRLAAKLEADPDLTVLAPWNPGAGKALRPKPNTVVLLARADRDFETVSRHVVPRLRATVDREVRSPVHVYVSGYPDVATGIHDSTVEAVGKAEMIAAPLLLIILLLVFRSPIAAGLPLGVGLTTIGAGSGVLDLLNRATDLNAVAMSLLSLMGLALGVDYGLVLVSRFREELEAGHDREHAAHIAVRTAGRTIVYASVTLGVSILGAFLVAPGPLLESAAIGVMIAVGLSLIGATTALPAALALLGPAIDRWRIGGAAADDGRLGGLALRTLRRPVVAAVMVVGLIVALGSPALALETGPPTARVLPEHIRQRADFDKIQGTLGGAWTAPYQITVATRKGAVTDPKTLRALARWQRRTARRADVQAVFGPGDIEKRARGIPRAERQLASAGTELRSSKRGQRKLADGLSDARDGSQQLHQGLDDAAAAADLLAAGGRREHDGAQRLMEGLTTARAGAKRLENGIAQARSATGRLAKGARSAAGGAGRLERGLSRAGAGLEEGLPQVRKLAGGLDDGATQLNRLRQPAQMADRELQNALAQLDQMLPTSRLDPAYRRAYESVAKAQAALSGRNPLTGDRVEEGYDGLDASLAHAVSQTKTAASGTRKLVDQLGDLRTGLDRLEAGAGQLHSGTRNLSNGATDLDDGLDQLAAGASDLRSGVDELLTGAKHLADGSAQLPAGAEKLSGGLSDGAEKTSALATGIGRMRNGVVDSRAKTDRLADSLSDSKQLRKTMGSGFFLVAALDRSSRGSRIASSFAVNVDRGGTAAQLTVIPNEEVAGKNARRQGATMRHALERSLADLERQTGLETRLGGPRAEVEDFQQETRGRYWLLVLSLVTVTFVVLLVMLRSLLLPLLAVVLNLLTIAAAFGVLTLLFQGDAPLGGPGFLDAIMVMAIFAVAFGLSIDYEVFMLARMREGYIRTGTTDGAIEYGLRRTAHVITGGAVIMTGVFVAFALSDISSMRQLGIGLTTAVLLDATVIRLVLLPAAMRLLGDATWWMPRWLDRLLPEPRHEVDDAKPTTNGHATLSTERIAAVAAGAD